ncbi:MAG: hypothetical protein QNI96_05305, partial [Woeseiaceae bacterium]|nr:hypothetical protein [Woeseiaceae bacterium]
MSFIPSGVAAAAAAGVSPTPPFPDLPPGGVASEYTVVAGESVNLIGYNTDPDSGQSIGTISPTTEWINDQFAIVTKAKNKFGEAGSVFTLQSAAPPPNSDTIFHSMRVRGVFAGSSEVQVYTQLRTGSIYSTDGINKSSWEQGSISDVWVDGNTYDVQLVRVPLYSPVFTGRIYCRMEDTGLEGFVAYRTANTQAMWVVVPYDDAQDIRLSRRDTDGAYTLVSLPDGSTPEWLTYNDDTNSPGSQNYLYFVQEGAPNQDRCHFAIADIDSEWNMITDRASLAVKAELFDP